MNFRSKLDFFRAFFRTIDAFLDGTRKLQKTLPGAPKSSKNQGQYLVLALFELKFDAGLKRFW